MSIEELTDAFFAASGEPSVLVDAPGAADYIRAIGCRGPAPAMTTVGKLFSDALHETQIEVARAARAESDVRARHEAELANLIGVAEGLHRSVASAIVEEQARELEEAIEAAARTLHRRVEAIKAPFSAFLETAQDDVRHRAARDIAFVEPLGDVSCVTFRAPNPLRGSLVGARPRDPGLLPIVLNASMLRDVEPFINMQDSEDKCTDHLARLACHRLGLFVVNDADTTQRLKRAMELPDMCIAQRRCVRLPALRCRCCFSSAFWACNVILFPDEDCQLNSSFWRMVLSLACLVGADIISTTVPIAKRHCVPPLVTAVAAAQIENNDSRYLHGWLGQHQLQYNGQHVLHACSKVHFNLPFAVKLFLEVGPHEDLLRAIHDTISSAEICSS